MYIAILLLILFMIGVLRTKSSPYVPGPQCAEITHPAFDLNLLKGNDFNLIKNYLDLFF